MAWRDVCVGFADGCGRGECAEPLTHAIKSRNGASHILSVALDWARSSPRNAAHVQCEIAQLSAGQSCADVAVYVITVSYLGRQALTIPLCRLHVMDIWQQADTNSQLIHGSNGHVKSVAVKKI